MAESKHKRAAAKTNLIISAVFHTVVIGALFFFAAREGILGKQLKKIAITMAPKEKPEEKPKQKEEPKPEPPKADAPKIETVRPVSAPRAATAPAAAAAPPSVAPPVSAVPSFSFEGGKVVESSSDPVTIYKGFVEFTLRSKWTKPEDITDESFVAEVELNVEPTGKLAGYAWKKGSGNSKWDDSVKKALAQTSSIGRPPPKGFPGKFLVRFDVQTITEPVIQ